MASKTCLFTDINGPQFSCGICHTLCSTTENFRHHLKSLHNLNPVSSHVSRQETGSLIFRCKKCLVKFDERGQLESHLYRQHETCDFENNIETGTSFLCERAIVSDGITSTSRAASLDQPPFAANSTCYISNLKDRTLDMPSGKLLSNQSRVKNCLQQLDVKHSVLDHTFIKELSKSITSATGIRNMEPLHASYSVPPHSSQTTVITEYDAPCTLELQPADLSVREPTHSPSVSLPVSVMSEMPLVKGCLPNSLLACSSALLHSLDPVSALPCPSVKPLSVTPTDVNDDESLISDLVSTSAMLKGDGAIIGNYNSSPHLPAVQTVSPTAGVTTTDPEMVDLPVSAVSTLENRNSTHCYYAAADDSNIFTNSCSDHCDADDSHDALNIFETSDRLSRHCDNAVVGDDDDDADMFKNSNSGHCDADDGTLVETFFNCNICSLTFESETLAKQHILIHDHSTKQELEDKMTVVFSHDAEGTCNSSDINNLPVLKTSAALSCCSSSSLPVTSHSDPLESVVTSSPEVVHPPVILLFAMPMLTSYSVVQPASIAMNVAGLCNASSTKGDLKMQSCASKNSAVKQLRNKPSVHPHRATTNVSEVKNAYAQNHCHIPGNVNGSMSEVMSYSCEVCHMGLESLKHVKGHKRYHSGHHPYLCKLCGYAYDAPSRLREHCNGVHDQIYQCDICGKRLAKRYYLKVHKMTHDPDFKPYQCNVCNAKYRSQKALDNHKYTHTADGRPRPFKCDVCAKVFTSLTRKNTHMTIHQQIAPFLCEFCGKAYRNEKSVIRHRFTHTGGRPPIDPDTLKDHPCQTCGKVFKHQCGLYEHMKRHLGEKPFVCQDCGKKFMLRHQLMTHMRTHTGERPFVCRICKRGYKTVAPYTSHMLGHAGKKPYCCKICGRKFVQSQKCRDHIRNIHKILQVSEVVDNVNYSP